MGDLCKKKLAAVKIGKGNQARVEKAIEKYGYTSALLYNLSQHGFAPDIMKFGMNVVMDAINFGAAVMNADNDDESGVIDLAAGPVGLEEA